MEWSINDTMSLEKYKTAQITAYRHIHTTSLKIQVRFPLYTRLAVPPRLSDFLRHL